MKMNAFLSIIVLTLLFMSCNKHNDDEQNNNTSNNSKRLRAFKYLEGSDSLKYTYTYDNQNRISITNGYSYQAGALTDGLITTNFYNGNDTLPLYIKSDFTDNAGTITGTAYEYFYYNASGKLIKDSIQFSASYSIVYNFEYFTDHFKVTTTNVLDTVITEQTISNGNVTAEMDTVYGPFISDFSVNEHISYDNHPNPFFYTAVRRVLHYMPENELQEDIIPAFKNNPSDYTRVTTGMPPQNDHTQYTYVYDADGYPTTVNITDVINSTTNAGYYYY